MRKPFFLILGASLLLVQCKKHDPDPASQLPPATQTGANTFGCVLNGQAFLPNGNTGFGTGNLVVIYDPTFNNGSLNVSAIRYTKPGDPDTRQSLGFFASNLHGPGHYPLTIVHEQEPLFIDQKTQCEFLAGDAHYRAGELVLTRVDGQAGIVSGTFSFKLYKSDCDSVIVTQGRFDKKL